MTLPKRLLKVLPDDMARTWEVLGEILPNEVYLGGGTAVAAHLYHRESRDLDFFYHREEVNLVELEQTLGRSGEFVVTEKSPGTLNGLFSKTKLQFLHADEGRPQILLEPTQEISGIAVAGIGDLMAMKLNVIAAHGELRDYFDLMTIEQEGGRRVEEGLSLYLARYQLPAEPYSLQPAIRALGYLDDIDEDVLVPIPNAKVAEYWAKRMPRILREASRVFG